MAERSCCSAARFKTPPMSESARREAEFLLRRLQQGDLLALPHSRPMPGIGQGCHELRINDENKTWRIIYRIDDGFFAVFGGMTWAILPNNNLKSGESCSRGDSAATGVAGY